MKKSLILFIFFLYQTLVMAQIIGHITVNQNDVKIKQGEGFSIIEIDKMQKTNEVGNPQLPIFVKSFVIPIEAEIESVDITNLTYISMDGKQIPYPVQHPIEVGEKEQSAFVVPNKVVYNGSNRYPFKRAEIINDYFVMGYHIVNIQFNPIAFNPLSKKIELFSFKYSIRYRNKKKSIELPISQSHYRFNLAKNYIKSIVENPQDVELLSLATLRTGQSNKVSLLKDNDEFKINALQNQIPEYIIITNKVLHNAFQRLADWKTQKGLPAIIKDIEDISNNYNGCDLSEKLHNYLRECYYKWGSSLFVLLGGDTNIVPARFYKGRNIEIPSDAYYTDLNSSWNANNNGIFKEHDDGVKNESLCTLGRASVENIDEANTFVNKVLSYEQFNSGIINKDYLKNYLIASAYITKNEDGSFTNGGQQILKDTLNSYSNKINPWFLFDNYSLFFKPDKKQEGTELNKNSFLKALNNGGSSNFGNFHIIYHMDHCAPRLMSTSGKMKSQYLDVLDVDNLSNDQYPFIMITSGCEPAQFNLDCIGEHFLNNPKGGAVAFIGNANNGYAGDEKMFGNFLHKLLLDKINHLGLLNLSMNHPFNSYTYYCQHLLGDPEMPIWSDVPKTFNVKITPDKVASGENDITIQIINLPEGSSARVCFMKESEAYSVVNINDAKKHTFKFKPILSGVMKITITAPNFVPFIKELPVEQNTGTALSAKKIIGISDGLVAGIGTALQTSIFNTGKNSAKNVKARLITTSPYVTVTKDSVSYGNIPSGAEANGASKFIVSVKDNSPEMSNNQWNSPCFYLIMQQEGTETVCIDSFKVGIIQPKLKIESVTQSERPSAGGNITLTMNYKFYGPQTSQILNWQIIPLTKNVTVIRAQDNKGWLSVSKNYKNGEPMKLKIYLNVGNASRDSVVMDLLENICSVKKDKIYYTSTEKSISLYWDKMGTETMYNIYRSTSVNGIYVKLNKAPLTTRYYADENLSPLTTYYYKLSTLTGSYIESDLSSPLKTWTIYPLMLQKSPIITGTHFVYETEANAVDIDLDGKKEIVASAFNDANGLESAVAVVRPDGTEPYDLDSNVTTFGGYAKMPWSVMAAPVVFDYKGRGEKGMVVLPRSEYPSAGNYRAICFSSLDKDGNHLPDTLWQANLRGEAYRAPIAADIDMPNGKGEKEIVVTMCDKGLVIIHSDGSQTNLTQGLNISNNYHMPTVADLDGDGYKEIIFGHSNDLYIWRHDGKPFNEKQPFFHNTTEEMRSTAVVCDLNGDGKKEIIIATRNQNSHILAIGIDGKCLPGFDGTASAASIPYPRKLRGEGLDHALSVGDINGDGKIEVVSIGQACVKAWDNSGRQLFNRSMQDVFNNKEWDNHRIQPMLADVDGDGKIDIVFNNENKVYALHNNGSDVVGFPLNTPGEMRGSLCVADIDADGRSEIIAVDIQGYISVWKVKGSAIEWGRIGQNTGFTGEYVKGYKDPLVITSDKLWQGGSFNNDIYISKGTFTIASGSNLTLNNGGKLIVLNGANVIVDGATVKAAINVQAGGKLTVRNNATLLQPNYGYIQAEKGGIIDMSPGCVMR